MLNYCTRYDLYDRNDILVCSAATRATCSKRASKLRLSNFHIWTIRVSDGGSCEIYYKVDYYA